MTGIGGPGSPILRDPVKLRRLLKSCTGMYARAACRDPLLRSWEARKPHLAEVLAECRKAYCPDLPEPRPAQCQQVPPSELLTVLIRGWAEVDQAIFRLELPDATEAERQSRGLILPLLISQAAMLPTKVARPDDVVIDIGGPSGAGSLGVHCGGQVKQVTLSSEEPTEGELAQVLAALRVCTRRQSVVIRTQHPFGIPPELLPLIDRLRSNGVAEIFQTPAAIR